jgi:hypothetical protein
MRLIPQIFHRIWLGGSPLPDEYYEFGETWRALHPDWQMLLWSDDNLPHLKNSWAYHQANTWAARSNIARYELLFRDGGIYIDTDFECQKNLEPLLDGVECFVAIERENLANNAIIGAIPGHPFVADLVESLKDSVLSLPNDDPAIVQSGPYYLTEILRRHPEVTVFPAKFFYPYQWNERWRKYDEFPDAYAVHHWSLSSRTTPQARISEDNSGYCLSVVVCNSNGDNGLRIEWVLEGLSRQSVSNFEVIVVNSVPDLVPSYLIKEFRKRMDLTIRNAGPYYKFMRRAAAKNLGLSAVCSSRTLFLDGDCVPDPDIVEVHSKFGAKGFVPFGFKRIYPAEKSYRFIPPLDYAGLESHSSQDPRRDRQYEALHGDWRDVMGFSVSAPTDALRELGGFDYRLRGGNEDKELAKRLSEAKYRLVPLWNEGYVTQLVRGQSEGAHVSPNFVSGPMRTGSPPRLEILDRTDNVIATVQVGLWDHAFNTATGTLLNGQSESTNFVGSDSHRFKFQVRDSDAHGEIVISWRTTFDDNSDDDAPAVQTLTLSETGSGSGVFVSHAVMLVTDDDDKAQVTNTGLAPGDFAGPGQANHRLRKIKVDGSNQLVSKIAANYNPLGRTYRVGVTAPVFARVPEFRRRMRVHLVNVRITTGGVGILTTARRDLVTATFRSIYARCGIYVDIDEILLDPPASCIGWPTRYPSDPIAQDPSVEGFSLPGSNLIPSASQTAIISAVRAQASFNANDIYIVCVARVYNAPVPAPPGPGLVSGGGEAFPDSWTSGTSRARGFGFVGVASGITEFADVHEATHITTNLRNVAGGHFDLGSASAVTPGPIDGKDLMNRFFLGNGSGVSNPKRLWDDSFTNNNRTPPIVIPPQIDGIRSSRFVHAY